MSTPANRASFTLDIAGVEHDLRVLEFHAQEAISRPFSARIELVSERANLDLEALLHLQAYLRFDGSLNGGGNGLHGQIGEISQGDSGKRFTHYFIQLVPTLKRLGLLGSQHALVTGPLGEEVHCDEYGRGKVKFFWDREGGLNEHSSCWLRVATGWAHDQYGAAMIPYFGFVFWNNSTYQCCG